MRLLVLGDAHLTSPTVPEISVDSTGIDFVIVVGDLLDQRCHSPEIGVKVLEGIVRSVAPVGYVPGNHDYSYRDALTDVDGVTDLTSAHSRDGVRFVGLGCDRFDAGVEIEYLDSPFQGDAEQVDEWLDDYREHAFQSSPSTSPDPSALAANGIERYRYRLQHLRDGFSSTAGTGVLVSHVPPFNTQIDVIREDRSPLQGHHWGSLAVRHALREYSPPLCLCGHIHGSAGVVDVDGTLCVNPGYRCAKTAEISGDSVEIEDTSIEYGRGSAGRPSHDPQ